MKKIIPLLLLLSLVFWNSIQYSQAEENMQALYQQKIDTIFTNFFQKIALYESQNQFQASLKVLEWVQTLRKKYTDSKAVYVLPYAQKKLISKINNYQEAISPTEYQEILGVWMDVDWSKTQKGSDNFSETQVQNFNTAGISHVRIRIKDDINETLLTQIDTQVQESLKNGIIPIIAYQADFFKKNPTSQNADKVAQWWKTMATHFENTSSLVSFDIIIEPTDALNTNSDALNMVYEKSVSAIRESSPTRIIFIAPRVRADPTNLSELSIPTQANGYLMIEWHFYAAGPSKTNTTKLWTTGTDSEKKLIDTKIQAAVDWSKTHQILTWVWAWMPGDYNDGNNYTIEEQRVFAHFMSCELQKNNIPYAANQWNKFYDDQNNTWLSDMYPVLQEIISPQC